MYINSSNKEVMVRDRPLWAQQSLASRWFFQRESHWEPTWISMALIPTLFLPGVVQSVRLDGGLPWRPQSLLLLIRNTGFFSLMLIFAVFLQRAPVSATKPKKFETFGGATDRCIFMHQGISLNPTDWTSKQSITTAEFFPRHSPHFSLSTAATKQL